MTEKIIVRKVMPTDLKQGDVIINIGTVTEIEVYKNVVVAHITHPFFNNRIDYFLFSPNFPVTVRP